MYAGPTTVPSGALKLVRNVPSDRTVAYWTILFTVDPWTNVSDTVRAGEKRKPLTSIVPPTSTMWLGESANERADPVGGALGEVPGVGLGVERGVGDAPGDAPGDVNGDGVANASGSST